MAGKPGAGGPVPKRSDQRRRRNKPETPIRQAKGADSVEIPEISPDWHPIARDWYESLAKSGQSQFYEPSDWASARLIAEVLSRLLNQGQRLSGQLFASVLAAMTELLTTEGARRRARIELEREQPAEEPASVAIMAKYRRAAGSKS